MVDVSEKLSCNDVCASRVRSFSHKYVSNAVQLTDPAENFLTCPTGFLFLLTVLFGGGAPRNKTATQLWRALPIRQKWELSDAFCETRNLYEALVGSLTETVQQGNQQKSVINVSNAMFLAPGYTLRKTFSWRAQVRFNATVRTVDFTNASSAMRSINTWVDRTTAGLIPRIIQSEGEISQLTRLVLMNVFTFKDSWRTAFIDTNEELFMVSAKKSIQVPMMSVEERLPYVKLENMGISVVRKFMENSRFSFVIVLPTEKWNMTGAETVLTGQYSIQSLFRSVKRDTYVWLKLPKFKLESNLNLIPVAQRMGISDLFDADRADLSGMTGRRDVYVTALKQGTVLKVDEHGVEAASATFAAINVMALPPPAVKFHVKQPFVCMIYDELLDLPLITARVMQPNW